MFIPICICALDPGLYKNVKHFIFILGYYIFWTSKKNNDSFSLFPFIFNVGTGPCTILYGMVTRCRIYICICVCVIGMSNIKPPKNIG